ncbi:MAG: carbonic anhydrase [Planctomycetota bacterium]
MSKFLASALFVVLCVALSSAYSKSGIRTGNDEAEFGYACKTCPANWGYLDKDYVMCADGESQSPICISTASAERTRLADLRFMYRDADLELEHLCVNVEAFAEGQHLRVGDTLYEFVQFHFHSLSEHFVDGEQAPLEMHFVHRAEDESLLVVGRFVEIGDAAFEPLQPFIDALSDLVQEPCDSTTEVDHFDLAALVPEAKHSYRYMGSTTTPPCAEGVQWILMAETLVLSEDQVNAIQADLRHLNGDFDNFRPIQSRNGRVVYTDVGVAGDDGDDDSDSDSDSGSDSDDDSESDD